MDEIYGDLIKLDIEKYQERIDALELHIYKLNDDIQTLCIKMLEMRETQTSLVTNISVLYKTAKNEIQRKDRMIMQLRKEKDDILFRKGHFSHNKRAPSSSSLIENKISKSNKEKEPSVQESKENAKIATSTSGNKDESKVIDAIDVNKDDRTRPRSIHRNNGQSTPKIKRKKEQDRKKDCSKDHKNISISSGKEKRERSISNSKEQSKYKDVVIIDKMHHKDRRKSPNAKTNSKGVKDIDKSKSNGDNFKPTSTQENRRSPRSNSHTSMSSSHRKRKHEHISSKSSTNKYISHDANSSIDLRDKLLSKTQTKVDISIRRSISSDKHSLKGKRTHNSPKKNRVASDTKIYKLEHEDIEEGEVRDELFELIQNITNTENVLKHETEHCRNTNNDVSLAHSKQGIPNVEIVIDTSKEIVVTEKLHLKSEDDVEQETEVISSTFDTKPSDLSRGNINDTRFKDDDSSLVKSKEPLPNEATVIEVSKEIVIAENIPAKDADHRESETISSTNFPCVNMAETRINEDNIVELHINPKSDLSGNDDLQTELLLAQLEGSTNLDTSPILKSSDNVEYMNVEFVNSIESQKHQQNNENINTSNNINVLIKDQVLTAANEAPKRTSLCSSGRRRRRAIVFIS